MVSQFGTCASYDEGGGGGGGSPLNFNPLIINQSMRRKLVRPLHNKTVGRNKELDIQYWIRHFLRKSMDMFPEFWASVILPTFLQPYGYKEAFILLLKNCSSW